MSKPGTSWGRYPRTQQTVVAVLDRHRALPALEGSLLPYGNGRSYGDSCLNDGGSLLHMRSLDRFIAFDRDTGVLDCEAGILFGEILELAIPHGWFLPVTPGTRFVTVGGAIANDVHGKNHHRAGCFSNHVLELELLRSNGERIVCSPGQNADWFMATAGGLGLTGAILRARIQMRAIAGPWMRTETRRFEHLSEFFELSRASEPEFEYTVAWIDCAAKGKALGRGVYTCANHHELPAPADRPSPPKRHWRMPVTPPVSLINQLSLRAFNTLYFRHQPHRPVSSTAHYEPYFYPLDSIHDWNRMYGPRGFLQYQCVVPPGDAEARIAELLGLIATSGTGSFLAVLKQFGDIKSPGMLSFPRPGTTLALDFPNSGSQTMALLSRLDDVVSDAGGAVYPAKDARMSGTHFRQYFDQWEHFRKFIDPRFSSSFWRRVME